MGLDTNSNACMEQCKFIWQRAIKLTSPDAATAHQYLVNRGLAVPLTAPDIRFCRSLDYWENTKKLGSFPAIVGRITNSTGNGTGLHRIYLQDGGKKASVTDPKKVLGSYIGGSIHLGEPGDTLCVAEGLETALAVQFSTGIATWSAISACGMKAIEIPSNIRWLHIWADKDLSRTGEEAASALADRYRSDRCDVSIHLPDDEIPKGAKTIDWLDRFNKEGAKALLKQLEEASSLSTRDKSSTWGKAEDFPLLELEAPALPIEMLPPVLRDWIQDIAERKQIPLEMPAAAAIVALGAAIGRRCSICPKQTETAWRVYPNLWGAIIAPPSTLKSPVIEEVLSPLNVLDKEANDASTELQKKNRVEQQVIEAKIGALTKELEKATRSSGEASDDLKGKLLTLNGKMESLRVKRTRFIVNDATIEKLLEILADNPNGVLIFRDELFGFLKTMEKQGHEGDRAFYLECWKGSGAFVSDRIGRGTISVPALCASIFGGIQPAMIQKYFSEVIEDGCSDDGFFPRFQVAVFPEMPKKWKRIDRPHNEEARAEVEEIFRKLARKEIGEPLRFDPEAQELFNEWHEKHELRLRSGEIWSPAFQALLGKYRSLMPALALVFHCAEVSGQQPVPPVSIQAARFSAAWCEYLEQHAKKIYAGNIRPEIQAARTLATRIRTGDVRDGDIVRNIYRKGWSLLKTQAKCEAAIAVLEELGWVRTELRSSESELGGRPAEIIRINPDLPRGAG